MDKRNYCVIMAGGIGARFWPMSRQSHPKQFIDILGTGETLIQMTFRRFERICPSENIYIVTTDIYKELIKQQLPKLDDDQILCEPARRNTAPCIAYAVYKIADKDPEANVVVAPSDHIILKEDSFNEIIKTGLKAVAKNNWLLTLGIKPGRPDTGYGYIQFDESIHYSKDERIRKVKTFTEKPEREMAKSFLKSGDFLWNSGIFLWRIDVITKAFNDLLEEVDSIFSDGIGKYNTSQEQDFISKAYTGCRNISIDYGIMEKADNVYVLIADFGWSDLGTWGALYETRRKDDNGNTIVGNNVLTYHTQNCVINMPKNKLTVLQGLDEYIVVEDDNILLVCRKQDEQQIRQFVNDVKAEKGDKYI